MDAVFIYTVSSYNPVCQNHKFLQPTLSTPYRDIIAEFHNVIYFWENLNDEATGLIAERMLTIQYWSVTDRQTDRQMSFDSTKLLLKTVTQWCHVIFKPFKYFRSSSDSAAAATDAFLRRPPTTEDVCRRAEHEAKMHKNVLSFSKRNTDLSRTQLLPALLPAMPKNKSKQVQKCQFIADFGAF